MAKVVVDYFKREEKEIEIPDEHYTFWASDYPETETKEYLKLSKEAWDFIKKACPEAVTIYGDSTIDILSVEK